MNKFIQFHVLVQHGPSNLNRDDLGRPKTVFVGGISRLRISSQCLKRSWRTSEVFESGLDGHLGTRTRGVGVEVHQKLLKRGVNKKLAETCAKNVASRFGKLDKDLKIGQLAHISPEEWSSIDELIEEVVASGKEPESSKFDLLRKEHRAADIALFGRMFADSHGSNTDAACQVAHAMTVHGVQVEHDYFTAVDDLKSRDHQGGAGHIGELGYGAGVYYLYVNVDREKLVENLSGDQELADKTLRALGEAIVTVSPSGKRNAFGSFAKASYALVETGSDQPRSLNLAFLKPVSTSRGETLDNAKKSMNELRENFTKVYGEKNESYSFDLMEGKGSLSEFLDFIGGKS